MALFLREAEVHELLTMPMTIAALEEAFGDWGRGAAANISRQRITVPQPGVLHVLPAAVPGMDALGLKSYTAFAGGARFLVLLYRASTGELLAMIEADWMGCMRTGAASGLATKFMARDDARTLGLIGTGNQARTQLMAIAAVRKLERARVWGRDRARLEAFCQLMAPAVPFPLEPAESAQAAVMDADIVATITTARDPVLLGEWVATGTHINAAGSNWHNRREIDAETLHRADTIVCDSVDQARVEAGDLIIPATSGAFDWTRAVELRDVVAGKVAGRRSADAITVFESLGIGLEDVATAMRVYELARAQGIGTELPIFS